MTRCVGDAGQVPAYFWDPAQYASGGRFVSDLGAPVVDLLAPRHGERILDLGCGDGALTEKLVEAGASVVGVDASRHMIDAARARGLDVRCHDARSLPFDSEFDAVFTNAALHWIKPMQAALHGAARALRPGGRLVGECGGHGCVAAVSIATAAVLARRGVNAALRYPWEFPTPRRFSAMVTTAGLELRELDFFPRPTPLPGSLSDWLETFAEPLLEPFTPGEREEEIGQEVNELAAPFLRDDEGAWTADYVRLRFVAVRPG